VPTFPFNTIFTRDSFDITPLSLSLSSTKPHSDKLPHKNVHVLCGGGFMDFIHRPKSKILKILQIKITTFRKLAQDGSSIIHGTVLYTIVKTF
jgi:hypothetical protein